MENFGMTVVTPKFLFVETESADLGPVTLVPGQKHSFKFTLRCADSAPSGCYEARSMITWPSYNFPEPRPTYDVYRYLIIGDDWRRFGGIQLGWKRFWCSRKRIHGHDILPQDEIHRLRSNPGESADTDSFKLEMLDDRLKPRPGKRP